MYKDSKPELVMDEFKKVFIDPLFWFCVKTNWIIYIYLIYGTKNTFNIMWESLIQ